MGNETSFPRQHARTQRFTLGAPRTFAVAPDGSRAVFLRSSSATSRDNGLWAVDTATGQETLLVDPATLLADAENLSAQERARRERTRESASGIVGYAVDAELRLAAFALSGKAFVADLGTGETRELPVDGAVLDPRPDPTGRHVAYVSGGALRVVGVDGSGGLALAEPDGPEITWGVAEFIAAEEMDRYRGYWWSPEGEHLLAARVDNAPVARWHIADPANPATLAAEVAYPAAGTANAEVSLAVLGLDGSRVDIEWDRAAFPYLNSAHWSAGGSPLLAVQSRDQRTLRVLAVDPGTGQTRLLREETDPHWVEVMPGAPAWTADGRLVMIAVRDNAYRLLVGDDVLTGDDLQVRTVLHVGDADVLISASAQDPTQVHVYRVPLSGAQIQRVSTVDGVHNAVRSGDTTVLLSAGMDWFGSRVSVLRGDEVVAHVASHAETPSLVPNVTLLTVGERRLRCALLLPTGHQPGSAKLPVLLDPYGGPHSQRVLSARNAYLASQWLADQGFAVLVADGRGTPGRGPDWDREIAFDFAGATLEDQVDAVQAVAAEHPDLDLSRVGIRGWSYGGYLSALAVLRRPDVFHAGIAGAPVTDWRLYDTHYTERYLGHPAERPEVYDGNSLIADAPKLTRPLMIIHGLADDNVVAAHTLRLSSALLEAGRPHTVLPLSGVTHMTPQEQVAENLLLLQVDFLTKALG
ncbi:S9 family peptidase [Solihabitans fulvus]|uniref:S9 family peptidase n=1 Tax=Solihabitans fulvus TaxID=1892852 RepID=A0A5B2X6I9_9PSEU|nr:prolyl oligopeptidase family serine peptidase [Solihabitans fulvus]KAA2258843.1 S9 family peptidase [Solihabitans fulvus]